jgi:hypothetical protein
MHIITHIQTLLNQREDWASKARARKLPSAEGQAAAAAMGRAAGALTRAFKEVCDLACCTHAFVG